MSSPKQVIIMRKDLKMPRGKIAAQAAHASMAVLLNHGRIERCVDDDNQEVSAYFQMMIRGLGYTKQHQDADALYEWLTGAFTKVCVCVESERELSDIYDKANAAGLLTSKIVDNGLTVFNGQPTWTCIAIGPAMPERIDPITSHLKLYN